MDSMFKFSLVKSQHASPKTLRQSMEGVLMAEDDKCAEEIAPYVFPPGVMGSREYDHCMAVAILLRYDEVQGGQVKAAMKAARMSARLLWDQLVIVYRNAGYQVKHGRVVGVLEDKSQENNESREDSVE